MKLYFAHPFKRRVENRRKEVDVERNTNIELFNPFYDDDGRKSDTQILDRKQVYDKLSAMDIDNVTDRECHMYIENVINNINRCDAVLAVPCDGDYDVSFIILLSNSIGKPVYVITEAFKDCPWFRVFSKCIFRDWNAFKAYLGSR
jgi:hypothetical protein